MRNHLALSLPSVLALTALALSCGDVVVQDPGAGCAPTLWLSTVSVVGPMAGSPQPAPHFSGFCLDRTPDLDAAGMPACVLLEGRHTGGSCACDPDAARRPVPSAHAEALEMAQQASPTKDHDLDCFCEIPWLGEAEKDACQNDVDEPPQSAGQPIDGVCYIDATVAPVLGNPELAKVCLPTEQRFLRLAGQASPTPAEGEVIVELLVCRQSVCAPGAG